MSYVAVVIVLSPLVALPVGISVYRRIRRRRFRRFVQRLSEHSDEKLEIWLSKMDLAEGIALRKALEGQNASTEVKMRVVETLFELGRFSQLMQSDYLVRLMLRAEGSEQLQIAKYALQAAKTDSSALTCLLDSLDRVKLDLLTFLMAGLADIAAAIPAGQRWHVYRPAEAERDSVVKKLASMLGHAEEQVRFTAAKLLDTKLSDYLVDAEGILMDLLRDSRREVKQLVASLTLDNEEQLKSAMCCVRGATHDLSPELRARL